MMPRYRVINKLSSGFLKYVLKITHCTQNQLVNFKIKCQILLSVMSDQEYQRQTQ